MWSPAEERDFSQLMTAGHLDRLPAIRLYRRCRADLKRALPIATGEAPTPEQIARWKSLGDAARERSANSRRSAATQ